jgi:hypothetical protein
MTDRAAPKDFEKVPTVVFPREVCQLLPSSSIISDAAYIGVLLFYNNHVANSPLK